MIHDPLGSLGQLEAELWQAADNLLPFEETRKALQVRLDSSALSRGVTLKGEMFITE